MLLFIKLTLTIDILKISSIVKQNFLDLENAYAVQAL